MPECTKAEREFLDAHAARPWSMDRLSAAMRVLDAERKRAQAAPDPRDARIAELEAELAKERERPREGGEMFVARTNGVCVGTWLVDQRRLAWEHNATLATFSGPDAERHAREHAAMLTAREEGADA